MRHAGLYHDRVTVLLTEMVLDAAREEIADRPWQEISMLQIAERAGVARTRLYQEFTSRAGLERALIARETLVLLAAIEQSFIENREHPRAALSAAYAVCCAAISDGSPLVQLLRGERKGDPREREGATRLLKRANSALREAVQNAWPAIDDEVARTVGETVLRLAVGEQLCKATETLDAGDVAEVLGPLLEQAVESRTAHGGDGPTPVRPAPHAASRRKCRLI